MTLTSCALKPKPDLALVVGRAQPRYPDSSIGQRHFAGQLRCLESARCVSIHREAAPDLLYCLRIEQRLQGIEPEAGGDGVQRERTAGNTGLSGRSVSGFE